MFNSTRDKVLNICKNNPDELMNLENVTGLGLGYKYVDSRSTGELCLHVLVEKKLDKAVVGASNIIPKNYMNIKTDVIEIGNIKASSLTGTVNPLQGGYSIGPNRFSWAGTLGCIVTRTTGALKEYFILSNNHVLSNGGIVPLGTPILQPSGIDGGIYPKNAIAILTQVIPINFTTVGNTVDCAIAKLINPLMASNKIALIGSPTALNTTPTLGLDIQKSGRTTEKLQGKIQTLGATVQVNYGNNKLAIFKDQILASYMSAPGDSGSLVLDLQNRAVGLLFAGSSTITVINRIQNVLSALKVNILM